MLIIVIGKGYVNAVTEHCIYARTKQLSVCKGTFCLDGCEIISALLFYCAVNTVSIETLYATYISYRVYNNVVLSLIKPFVHLSF